MADDPQITRVTSLVEYIDVVHRILAGWGDMSSATHSWFRGQADDSWGLLPGIYRHNVNTYREREMLRDFKLRATAFIQSPPRNDVELFFVMQHYGMPTRLLDWTESHLVALFFAVDATSDTDAAVWVLAPGTLNRISHTSVGDRVPMSDHDVFSEYTLDVDAKQLNRRVKAPLPMAVRPPRSTERVVAQRGMFTIHGSEESPIEQHVDVSQPDPLYLEKLTIAGDSKERIKKELFLAGISYSSLFPDLDGLSKEITYRYSTNYMSFEIIT